VLRKIVYPVREAAVHAWDWEPHFGHFQLKERLEHWQTQRILANELVGSLADQSMELSLNGIEFGDVAT
jgi:hypothetical protein